MYQQSEVKRLREQITAECQAMNQALYSFSSGNASHSFIAARIHRVDIYLHQLEEHVGEQEATHMLCELYNEAMS